MRDLEIAKINESDNSVYFNFTYHDRKYFASGWTIEGCTEIEIYRENESHYCDEPILDREISLNYSIDNLKDFMLNKIFKIYN